VVHPDSSATVNLSVTALGDEAMLSIVTAAHPALPLPRQEPDPMGEFRIDTEILEDQILATAIWRVT